MNNLTQEQTNKSREEFEEFYNDKFDGSPIGEFDEIEILWNGWLARQQTLCVELPRPKSILCTNIVLSNDRLKRLLSEAGIGFKND